MECRNSIYHKIHGNDGSLEQQSISQVDNLDRDGWRHVFVKQQLKIATSQPFLIKPLRRLCDAQG